MVGVVVAVVSGYLLGTLPSADVAARLASGGRTDLRAAGTGNPGAANAIKVLGPGWGYAVLVADIAKAVFACVVGRVVGGDVGGNAAGTAAVVGHCFPVWSGLRGGKGVACSAGQCLAVFPAYFPIDLGVALATSIWRRQAMATTVVASVTWVAAALAWWAAGWPNGWGPEPTVALPITAAASSAVIVYRFAAASAEAKRRTTTAPGGAS